ncbi:rhomboid-related protein 2-like [Anoplophora glabripennis]|uniref:rhomboid-related protein 2-like n=1 Tax=Anoplophora glabripennis TaxID=217634 RepID=UPI000874EABE|nr:rhomboid-related protein 2-like [Anoplophora glabripennis]
MSENTQIPLKSRPDVFYRNIFNKYDRNRDGFITVNELNDLIESREYEHDIPPHVVKKIHEMHDHNGDEKLDFQEFYDMINNPGLDYVFGHYVTRYVNWIIPKVQHPTRTVTDGQYEDEYSCYPPAVGMILFSLIEIIFFCVDEAMEADSTKYGTGPTATHFMYEPNRRREVWRYVTYMFVHIGVFHLLVNLLVQILLGIPLEMVHKWWRVLVVYFAGVLAGSLGTSIVDPTVKLAGASGGVYSLVTAHVASIIMNWKEMSFPAVQLLIFLIVAGSDISTAIYNRYVLDIDEHIGYAAHFAGALAGLLVGINVLRNLSVTRTERVIWWISIITYSVLMVTCIIWNLAWRSYFLKEVYSP